MENNSHAYRFQKMANEVAGPLFEKVVAMDDGESIFTAVNAVREEIGAQADAYQKALDGAAKNYSGPCNLRFVLN